MAASTCIAGSRILRTCIPAALALAVVSETNAFSHLDGETEHYAEACDAQSLLQLGRSAAVQAGSSTYASEDHTKSTCKHRVAWFHVPKAGTSLGNTLFHYVNDTLPAAASLPDQDELKLDKTKSIVEQFLYEYPITTWFPDCFWLRQGLPSTHQAITDSAFEEFNGDFVGMFREPKARAYSSWTFFGQFKKTDMTQDEYAGRMRGLVTKMLTGQVESESGYGYGANCSNFDARKPCDSQTEPDVPLALQRLDGFKFIGLTEHWDLSICLFHKMLGGTCRGIELTNVRPTGTTSDEVEWNYTDPADSAVYAKASQIFWSNIFKYNLTEESCASMCTKTQ